jgi:hypothetical protein
MAGSIAVSGNWPHVCSSTFCSAKTSNGQSRENSTNPGLCSFKYKLKQKRPANCVCVHLMDQENLMEFWSDEHPEPNIDIACVRFYGRTLSLPLGTQFATADDIETLRCQHGAIWR